MKDAKGHGSEKRGVVAAHQQGIDQIWSTNNGEANIKRAQQLLEAAGVKNDVYKNARASAIAHVQGDATVHLNASHKFWQNPMQHMEELTKVQNRWGTLKGLDHYHGSHYSSNVPEHVINHESAHTIYADVPKKDNKFTPTQVKMIREKVSGYAAHNPNEFVAEVHAGMKAGRQYPGEVMDLFKRYARKK